MRNFMRSAAALWVLLLLLGASVATSVGLKIQLEEQRAELRQVRNRIEASAEWVPPTNRSKEMERFRAEVAKRFKEADLVKTQSGLEKDQLREIEEGLKRIDALLEQKKAVGNNLVP